LQVKSVLVAGSAHKAYDIAVVEIGERALAKLLRNGIQP
jgi:hypothetical protein